MSQIDAVTRQDALLLKGLQRKECVEMKKGRDTIYVFYFFYMIVMIVINDQILYCCNKCNYLYTCTVYGTRSTYEISYSKLTIKHPLEI